MKSRFFLLLFLLLLWTSLGISCRSETEEPGVVARVNNRPIYQHQVEARYDLLHMNWAGGLNPTVAQLKEKYGSILSELIVTELVLQALEERTLSVSQEELDVAEAEVRADFPEGVFEQVLVEEYLDINDWRRQLRTRLAHKKFLKEVLRPRIKLNYLEAEAYYREHITDFYLPPRIRFLLITGPNLEIVEKAAAMYGSEQDTEALTQKFNQISVQELKMRHDRLPAGWLAALERLSPGETSPVMRRQNEYESLALLERLSAKVLPPSHAYPLVEKVLLERKLQEAFLKWLDDELLRADIKVSKHLLPAKPTVIDPEPVELESDNVPMNEIPGENAIPKDGGNETKQ